MNIARGRTGLGKTIAMLQIISLFSVSYFFFGCMAGGNLSSGDQERKPLEIVPARIPGLNAARIPAGQYVFNSQKEWDGFWGRYENTPAPEFDLKRFTLVAVFLGQRPNPGYSVKIVGATERSDKVVVSLIEYLPSPGMLYAQVIVYPYDAVLIPKTKKGIRFEVTKKAGQP